MGVDDHLTSWTIYALVIETPGSEPGIVWILVIQIVLCSISMWFAGSNPATPPLSKCRSGGTGDTHGT